ncbi:MAG TPA: exosortase E/protease, VPEID-CTERM system [Candidatus Xenobia bacterium]
MLLLLVAELEFIMGRNYELRTALRAQVHLPLYHTLLAFAAFAIFFRMLARLPELPASPLAPGWVAWQVASFLVIDHFVTPLSPSLGLWVPVALCYGGLWLACLVPPREWVALVRCHAGWMAAALVAAVLTVGLAFQADTLWRPLSYASLCISQRWLSLFFSNVVVDVDHWKIGTPLFRVQVLAGCSGLEGLGLMLGFSGLYLWLRRRELRFPAALTLVPVSLVLIFLANTVRLALLVAVGTCISPVVAIKGFHSQAGWISVTALGVGMILGIERWGWFSRVQVRRSLENPAVPYLLPLLVALALRMLTQLFTAGFDIFYPIRTVALLGLLFLLRAGWRPALPRPTVSGLWNGAAVFLLWALLVPGMADPSADPAINVPGWSLLWIAARVTGAFLVVPLCEELAFRGYLLRRLQNTDFRKVEPGTLTWSSVAISSLAFGLLHEQWLAGTLAGAAYAWATTRRGRLSDAVVAHAITNLCLSVQVLGWHQWSLWN